MVTLYRGLTIASGHFTVGHGKKSWTFWARKNLSTHGVSQVFGIVLFHGVKHPIEQANYLLPGGQIYILA